MYHYSLKIIKRSAGRSSTGASAYRAGLDITDERTGEIFKYGNRGGVLDHEILTPPRAPDEFHEAESLWNAVEQSEKRKDAQVARENVVALHHKLTLEQNRDLLHGFVKEAYVKRGMIAQVDIHGPGDEGDQRNIHGHVLLTMRSVNRNGLSDKKPRNWNSTEVLKEWRALWAQHMNTALEKAGIDDRVTEKSFQDLGLDKIPSKHLGVEATQMERRGEPSRIGDENRVSELFNRELAELEWQESIATAAIDAEKQRIAQKEHAQKTKTRYDYEGKKKQRLHEVDQSKARAAKRKQAKIEAAPEYFDRDAQAAQQDAKIAAAALEAENRRLASEKSAADKARIFKEQDGRKKTQEVVKRDTERIRAQGSFADELDKTRESEALQDKEAARIEEIWGQQEKNIAEGIKRGHIKPPPLESYETKRPEKPVQAVDKSKTAKEALAAFERTAPPPEAKQVQEQQNAKDMLDQFEKTPPPVPEPLPNPIPQQSFADMAQQYESAAKNDNTPAQAKEPEQQQTQQQSRDSGGLDR